MNAGVPRVMLHTPVFTQLEPRFWLDLFICSFSYGIMPKTPFFKHSQTCHKSFLLSDGHCSCLGGRHPPQVLGPLQIPKHIQKAERGQIETTAVWSTL